MFHESIFVTRLPALDHDEITVDEAGMSAVEGQDADSHAMMPDLCKRVGPMSLHRSASAAFI